MLHSQRAIFLFVFVFAMLFVLSENALAGQFIRIGIIPDGGEIEVHASPQNCCPGSAGRGVMETDVYEFESDRQVGDRFQCLIRRNATGAPLHLAMIGLDGNILRTASGAPAVCDTRINGTCAPFSILLPPNGLFQCRVSSGGEFGGVEVSPDAHYVLAIRRPPLTR
jgi:hypothetical protein